LHLTASPRYARLAAAEAQAVIAPTEWGHPLKGPCQEEKLILCEKIYFLAKLQCWDTSISTFAEISFGFRLQL